MISFTFLVQFKAIKTHRLDFLKTFQTKALRSRFQCVTPLVPVWQNQQLTNSRSSTNTEVKEVNYRHGSRGHNFSLMGLATSILLVCIHDSINTCELLVLQAGVLVASAMQPLLIRVSRNGSRRSAESHRTKECKPFSP